ncbi:MAG TPA: hypothetical protein VHI77_07285 [Solirubrobacterales bacterium]|jgi:hypothetical protein|nr:hypothetical protein [Solirubrobacterales bacterium]
MPYRTTREQRAVRLHAIADFLDCEAAGELLDLVDVSAPADHLSPQASAALDQLRRAFEPPTAPLFDAGQLVRIKGVTDPALHVVDLPHLEPTTDPRAGWQYAIREHPPASDDPGEVFAETELEAVPEPVA